MHGKQKNNRRNTLQTRLGFGEKCPFLWAQSDFNIARILVTLSSFNAEVIFKLLCALIIVEQRGLFCVHVSFKPLFTTALTNVKTVEKKKSEHDRPVCTGIRVALSTAKPRASSLSEAELELESEIARRKHFKEVT